MNRSLRVRQLPCIACEIRGMAAQCGPTEAHHLNLGGHAGMKRRGDEFQIPLGPWHHRGAPLAGLSQKQMATIYGPSLALQSKAFRAAFGSDDELLALTNERLGLIA
jgi:hypothetical protein